MSAAKRKELSQTDRMRKAFRESTGGVCMICEKKKPLEVHEIARGAARCKSVYNTRLMLVLCRECHEECGDLTLVPVSRQLAFRMAWEIERARQELNAARGRCDEAVTAQELAWDIAEVSTNV